MPSLLAFAWRLNRGKKSLSSTQKKQQHDHRDNTSVRVTSHTSMDSNNEGNPSSPPQDQVFVERDHNDHLYNHHRTLYPDQSPVPPAIQASQSSSDETCVTTTAGCNDTCNKGFHLQTTNEDIFYLARPRGVVVTPDGLKTRRSLTDLQAELGLESAAMDVVVTSQEEQEVKNNNTMALVPAEQAKGSSTTTDEHANNNNNNSGNFIGSWQVTDSAANFFQLQQQRTHFLSPNQQRFYSHTSSGLPPSIIPPPPSRSWSTDGTWSSPTPASHPSSSNPSSYGIPCFSWQTTPSAESPNLVPGQARTAVGHLVALAQQNQNNNSSALVVQQQHPDPPARNLLPEPSSCVVHSPLVSSSKEKDQSNRSQRVLITSSTPPAKVKVEPSGPLARMDSITKAPAPVADNYHQTDSTPPPKSSYDDDWHYSPQEESVEAMFSPMFSNKKPLSKKSSTASNTTSSSVLVPKDDRYSCCPESTSGVFVVSEPNSLAVTKVASPNAKPIQDLHALDGDFRRLKTRNQKRAKEDLLIAALERLQDDPQLVEEVQSLGMMIAPQPSDIEETCFLRGIDEPKRELIIEKLDLVLEELNSGVPADEFFLSSPMISSSECYRNDEEHIELREALQFCRVLVQMAIPEEEKNEGSLQGTVDVGRWQFLPGLREAIGIRVAVTPEARSMSCFSLPEDCNAETPMTSNRSFCCNSTLTTKDQSAMPLVASNGKNKEMQNGLDLRQAILDMTTGLHNLSRACRSLLGDTDTNISNMSGIVLARAMDQIKTTYRDHLLSLRQQDLKSLVNAFEFVLDDPDDSYEIHEDDDCSHDVNDHEVTYDGRHSVDDSANSGDQSVDYPIVHAAAIGGGNFSGSVVGGSDTSFYTHLSSLHPSIVEEDNEDDEEEDEVSDDEDDAGLFEYDDLRRQTGSSDDRDSGVQEERDCAPRDPPPEAIYHSGKGWIRLQI